jgi:hypothetical protein
MKEFDAFENSIKESVGGFADTKPSRMLWIKINASLLFAFLLRKTSLIVGTLSLATIASFSLIYSNNTTSLNNDNNTIKELHTNAINNSKKEPLNKTNNKSLSKINKPSKTIETSKMPKTNNTSIITYNTKNTKDNIAHRNHDNKNQNSSAIALISKPLNTNNPRLKRLSKTTSISNNNSNIINTTYAVNTQKNSPKKTENNNLTNESITNDIQKSNLISLNYQVLSMPLISSTNKYSTKSLMQNPVYKVTTNQGRKIYSDYEIFMGPNLNYSKFGLNPNNISDKELNKSSLLPSYHFGGNYNLYYKNWLIRSGLNYSTINEQINYTTTTLNIDSRTYFYTITSNTYTWDTTGWNTNVGGVLDSIPIVSLGVHQSSNQNSVTISDSTITTQKLQYKNSYTSINIPLLIGRRFNFDRFIFDIATGISWSHITKFETHILDPINGEVIIANQDNSTIKKDVFNGVLSIGAGYRLNGVNTLFIRPELQYNFNSIFDKSNFNNYKVLQMRLSIGLRYSIR